MSIQISLSEKEIAVLNHLINDNLSRYSSPTFAILSNIADKVNRKEFSKSGYSRFNKFSRSDMEKSRKVSEAYATLKGWELNRRLKEIEEYYK